MRRGGGCSSEPDWGLSLYMKLLIEFEIVSLTDEIVFIFAFYYIKERLDEPIR